MKKIISGVLCVFMVCTMLFTVNAQSKVTINLFGKNIEIPEDYGVPFIDSSTSRTLVPARGVFEAMGAEVLWDGPTRCVTVKKDADEIKLTIDSVNATKNGEARLLDQPAVLIGGRTFIPLRFIAESLNLEVGFDGATTTVIIKEKEPEKKIFEAGKYKIGDDIKVAEYLLISEGQGEVKLLRDENSSESANVISQTTFKNSIYINIVGASYIEMKNCKAYSLDSVPARAVNGAYKNGMFKIGFDFKGGRYTLSQIISSETSSYKIYDSSYSTGGAGIIKSEGLVTKSQVITLNDGQYIVVENMQIKEGEAIIGGGGSSGSGGSSRPSGGGGSSRPSGGTSTPDIPQPSTSPTEEPTVEPTVEPTEEPTEVPPQEDVETPDEPEVSTNDYYDDLEGEVLDFGYFYSIPLLSKSEGEAEERGRVITYTYDISIFLESGEFDSVLFSQFTEKLISSCGFSSNYKPGSKPGERDFINTSTGMILKTIPSEETMIIEISWGEVDPSLDDIINS